MLSADLNRPSWQCVHFAGMADARGAVYPLVSEGVAVFEIDAAAISGERDLFTAVDRALQLPDYFGMNWDALEECLRDLDWIDATGYIVLVTDADDLWRRNPQLAGKFLSSCVFAAEEWFKSGTPFHLVFAWGSLTDT